MEATTGCLLTAALIAVYFWGVTFTHPNISAYFIS
jgi:hypothetical protein